MGSAAFLCLRGLAEALAETEKARDEDAVAAAAAIEEVVVAVRKDDPTLVAKDIATVIHLTGCERRPFTCMCGVGSREVSTDGTMNVRGCAGK